MKGKNYPHPLYGLYQYDKIVQTFSEKGFLVISEVRYEKVHNVQYAKKISEQIRYLLNKGVPEENITVIGHSKGGHMSLVIASILQKKNINYVIMAGCGKKGTKFRHSYEKFLNKYAEKMQGRILSLYDSIDKDAGSCQEAFSKASFVKTKEVILETGKGHGLFYSPEKSWTTKVVAWAGL